MAADRQPSENTNSDDMSGAQLEQLLKTTYAAPEPTEAFEASLFEQLERQIAGQVSVGSDRFSETGGLLSGVAEPANPERATAVYRGKRRLAMALAAAASLLVAISFWGGRPAYGWAAMMQALEQCKWVQAVSSRGEVRGWISETQGVVAVQAGSRVAYRDNQTRVRSDYRADQQLIYRGKLKQKRLWNWQAELLALILQGGALQDDAVSRGLLSNPAQKLELVSESWKQVENQEGTGTLIELRVTLKVLGAESRLLSLVFLLDPESQLPVSCRLLEGEEAPARAFAFSYPQEGPTSIYSMGVPREAEVVSSLVSAPTSPSELAGKESRQPLIDLSDSSAQKPTPHLTIESAKLGDPLPPQALVEQINTQLASFWQSQGVRPAEPSSDAEFLRRIYLDLTGRIPRVSEAYDFLEDKSVDRRERLVGDLLERRDHATHLAAVWRTMLLPVGVDVSSLGGTSKFDLWLADRFGANLPYDQLVRQLLLAEGRVSKSGPLLFFAALKLNPEEIAAKTSRTFLGTRMECAQCHDHPFDDNISQEDFWGFAAFFAQISRPKGKMEVTSSVLRVRDNRHGEVMLPDSEEVVPPMLPGTDAGIATGPDALSRRRQLVDWLTVRHNHQFARATVNRVWAHLFGRGLVEPVDDMRAENQPICPEVLETLSLDFAASGYDLRKLFRALVLSDAYQKSSRAATDDPSQTLCFARMHIKNFSADQLYDCIAVATRSGSMGGGESPGAALSRLGNSSRQAFIQQFRAPPGQRTNYNAGIPQALTLMHGSLTHGATDLSTSGLLSSLNAPFFSDQQRIDTLFLATLSRLPEPEERKQMLQYVHHATNEAERQSALGDVLWALLNSAEFTFIH